MAIDKAIRSNSVAQPAPRRNSQPDVPQLKAEIFDTLRQLNRGYGSAVAALHRLQRPAIFPAACLRGFRNQTEALRAQANHDLLQLLAGHEERDAAHFGRDAIPKTRKHRS